MKTADEILESTDFPNYSDEAIADGWAWQCMIDAMEEYATQQTAAITAERDEYRKALERVVSPLKKIQEDAAEKGEKVDGAFAIMLIHDPTFLQNIAKESLDKYPQQ